MSESHSKPSLQPQQSNRSLETTSNEHFASQEVTVLQDHNKDLNKKIAALHKQVHKLEEANQLKD